LTLGGQGAFQLLLGDNSAINKHLAQLELIERWPPEKMLKVGKQILNGLLHGCTIGSQASSVSPCI
jgi:hypothetical protein